MVEVIWGLLPFTELEKKTDQRKEHCVVWDITEKNIVLDHETWNGVTQLASEGFNVLHLNHVLATSWIWIWRLWSLITFLFIEYHYAMERRRGISVGVTCTVL